ncbi:peroxisomal trans-2-enoyl-CoA reductase-like [Lineus longissimus]|uniref:peroxisomal trans-2-enoyl-CoA reductase-like n=1 Tax=Lineus longissimus TaxID=88925 RepID=UPI002B4E3B60
MAATMKLATSIFRPGLFAGKTAIVTGGGTGIGLGITKELLHLGCKVMIASRKEERLKESMTKIKNWLQPENVEHIQMTLCNIRKEEEVKKLMSHTIATFGGIDYLVNNGGGQFIAPMENVSLKGWNAIVETNLTGTFLCIREAFNQWMQQHGGAMVNITMDLWRGFPGFAASSAARAGIDNLTKSLAMEWAPSGVRINSLAPGTIYSETAAANYPDPNMFNDIIPTIPAKRLGTVEEVASAACFLLSPGASFITGESLKVDGGQCLYRVSWEIPDHDSMPVYKWQEKSKEEDKDKPKAKL